MKKQLLLLALPIALLHSYSYTEINISQVDESNSITVNATVKKTGIVDQEDWYEICEIIQDLEEIIQHTEGVKGSVHIDFDTEKINETTE